MSDPQISDLKTPAKIEDIFRFGGLSGPIAMSDVTGLVAALAAKADDSAVVHNTGNETVAGIKSLSDRTLHANGTVSLPGNSWINDPDTGFYKTAAANTILAACGGTLEFTLNQTAATFEGNLNFGGSMNGDDVAVGSSYNLTASSPRTLTITAASSQINLYARGWTARPGEFILEDPLGILTDCTLVTYDDGLSLFNDLNGADPVNGAWTDPNTFTTGPFGASGIVTTPFGQWSLKGATQDTGSGAFGGWNTIPLGVTGY